MSEIVSLGLILRNSKLESAEQGRALNQNRSAIDHNALPGSESFLHQK